MRLQSTILLLGSLCAGCAILTASGRTDSGGTVAAQPPASPNAVKEDSSPRRRPGDNVAPLRIIASDPAAEVLAADWMNVTHKWSLQSQLPDATEPMRSMLKTWIAQARRKENVVSGTGELSITAHLNGVLVIARKGPHIVAAEVEGASSQRGPFAVKLQAPAGATASMGRVPSEGLRLQLPSSDAPPNAIVLLKGYAKLLAIDGAKPPKSGFPSPWFGSMLSVSPGVHTMTFSYARPASLRGGKVYLPKDLEITFAIPPAHLIMINIGDDGERIVVETNDATENGQGVPVQKRSVQ